MRQWLRHLDELLRGQRTDPRQLATGTLDLPLRGFVIIAIILGAIYGSFMGWFAIANRPSAEYWQLIASTVKLPALFLLTLIVTLPSLYVFNALVGCRLSFGATLRLLVAAVVVNLAVAASLGTILGFFTLSTTSYPFMIVLNVLLLTIAGLVGLGFLLRTLHRLALWQAAQAHFEAYSAAATDAAGPVPNAVPGTAPPPLPRSDPRSPAPPDLLGPANTIFRIWVLIYALVGAQMGWLLRPFIGNPGQEFTWFRPRSGNFFEAVFHSLKALLDAMNHLNPAHADDFLRGRGAFTAQPGRAPPIAFLIALVLAYGPLYGAVMGAYILDSPERLLQVLYAAIKVPLLLFATGALCLPAFFVLNTVLGLRDDFRAALAAILSGQAALGVALASLAPLTCVWYLSERSYRAALLFNAAMFALATLAAHIAMLREYRALIRRRPAHRIAWLAWLVLYSFVGIQMGWMLRPFIGDPGLPTTFFRQEPFSNAYVIVARLILGSQP